MAFRKVTNNDLVGKTISDIDANSINVLRLTFTDDSSLELWAEDAVQTLAGAIPGIYVSDDTIAEGDAPEPTQVSSELFNASMASVAADYATKMGELDRFLGTNEMPPIVGEHDV